jgi:hypothetical protein
MRESFGEEPRLSQKVFASAKLRFVGKYNLSSTYALSRKHDKRASASKERKKKKKSSAK